MKIATVIGARPQFIKAFVLSRALRSVGGCHEIVVHTGQHYDDALSGVFFRELGLRPPDYNLGVDELDRSDEEFEAYLLELLSDFQITIPEIGTVRAKETPVVIITSNRTREIHDALRRRCMYYWIDFPTLEKEYSIVMARMPEAPERLAKQVCHFVRELRSMDLYKAPGVAETLDWISSLLALHQLELVEGPVRDTLGALLKYQDDVLKVGGSDLHKVLKKAAGVS